MKEIPLNSSALSACAYDPQRQFLWIHFRTGERYVYQTIPAAVVQALLQAPSQGKYYNSAIRQKFPFRLLS
jgi:hypothetical protein